MIHMIDVSRSRVAFARLVVHLFFRTVQNQQHCGMKRLLLLAYRTFCEPLIPVGLTLTSVDPGCGLLSLTQQTQFSFFFFSTANYIQKSYKSLDLLLAV